MAYIWLGSLASQPYFSTYAHARAKVGRGREGKYVWADTCQVFVTAWYARNVFHVYIYNILRSSQETPVDLRGKIPVSLARLP